MNRIIHTVFVLCTILFSSPGAYSQDNPKIQIKTSKMNQSATKSDKEILSGLNAQFIKNFINQDADAHNKIIHKHFVCINGDGSITNREDYIKGWATGYQHSGYTSFSYTDEYIRIFGNMALVRSKTVFTKTVDGKEVGGNSVYTDTYIKENGEWLCVQAQITRIIK
jgi:ketosteroid isomerase-like protein